MAVCFYGKDRRKFDQTSRISIPPMFREGLGQTIYLIKSPQNEPCLVLYSAEEWARYMRMVASKFKGVNLDAAERKLSKMGETINVETGSRISIKEEFRKYAQLDDEVLIVGVNNRVELWLEKNFDEYSDDIDLSGLGLDPGEDFR